MAGIPPLIGFFSKQLVLYSALQNGYFFISVLAIIVSVISCSYYLQIIKVLFTPSDGHARHSFGVPTATQEAVATQEAAISSTAFKPKATESSESLVLNRRTSSEGAVLLRNKREGSTSSCGNPLLRRVARDKPLPLLSLGEESPSGATQQRRGVKNEIHLTNTHSYLISTLTFTILLFFIKPSLILNSTQLLSLSLFYI
jgi:NADH-ubiquinone oxidoreductase chain 2